MGRIDPEHAKADALTRFADTGPGRLNCAQAVLLCGLHLTELDPSLVVAARYFGGGIARIGEVCGAVSGAALALGLRDWQSPERDADQNARDLQHLQELMRDFAAEFGSCKCAELTGHDLSTAEGYKVFRKSEASGRCPGYVAWVCDRLASLLTPE